MMIVGPLAAMVIQIAICRSREYGADAGGATISGNPRHLANALRKLDAASRSIPMHASPATAYMFMVEPPFPAAASSNSSAPIRPWSRGLPGWNQCGQVHNITADKFEPI